MYRMLEKNAASSVEKAMQTLGWGEIEEIKFEEPPQRDMGDLATSVAFQLAGKHKKSPVEISKRLEEVLEVESPFERAGAAGPYLNFYLNLQFGSRK